ncbi:hypothetical protein [Pengzhenrongella sicca]|uniref:Uncharacterized protein n=1 Tax=Pengzhenrongella sicca TaxID=2819238 RepID=A0A8A4ZAH8_9MICO|nr:hypothetical protein [Pengzhenrongella sicca]QTE27893.1 hypothetical protein J4E96_10740 [Pengzhenrongella sicca]
MARTLSSGTVENQGRRCDRFEHARATIELDGQLSTSELADLLERTISGVDPAR